jgi:DNA-binding NtrC family response regulator
MPKIVLVDDEEIRKKFLEAQLNADCPQDDHYDITHVTHWDALKGFFENPFDGGHEAIDLIALDVNFSNLPREQLISQNDSLMEDANIQGFLILEEIRKWEEREKRPPSRIMMFSNKVPTLPENLSDYMVKYKPQTYLFQERSATDIGLVEKIKRLCPAIDKKRIEKWKTNFNIVCGKSRKMYELMCRAEQIAKSDCNVWVAGPTGVGKELMAQFIHRNSRRANDFWALLDNLVKELWQLRNLGADIFGDKTEFTAKAEIELTRAIPGLLFPHHSLVKLTQLERREKQAELEMNYGRELEMLEELEQGVDNLANSFKNTLLNHIEVPEELWKKYLKQVEDNFPNAPRQQGLVHLICREVFKLWRQSPLFGFKAFNCAELSTEPNSLFAKLFGVPVGAFTSVEPRPGIIKSTSYVHGTLFLDEIGDLKDNPQAQGALLRVLQEGELVRAQASTVEKVNIRVIAATNKDIYQLINKNEFRHDLFTRLAQAYIEIPSLAERREDIPELIDCLFDKKVQASPEIPDDMEFDPLAISYLANENWEWYGNIRELKNVIDRAVELAYEEGEHKIQIDHLSRTLDPLRDIHPVRKESPTDSTTPLPPFGKGEVGEFLIVWAGSEAPPKLSNGVHPQEDSNLQERRTGEDTNQMFFDKLSEYVETLTGNADEMKTQFKVLPEQIEELFIKQAVRKFIGAKGPKERGLYAFVGDQLGIDRRTASDEKGKWRPKIDHIYKTVLQEEGLKSSTLAKTAS